VITNDYAAENPLKKGYPEGHVPIKRHMNIPLFDDTHIVMVAGVGNKTSAYDDQDVHELSVLMIGLWNVIKQRKAEEELIKKNEELRATYEQITASEEELRAQYDNLAQSERTLRLSENRLLMAQNIGHLGYWEYSFETGKMWGSPEALRIYGFPSGSGYYSLNDVEACVEDREQVQQAFTDFIAGKREYDIEITVNPRDGSSQRVVHSLARLEKDARGNPVRVLGIIQDITDRKRAEEALRESEEKYRTLVENVVDIVYRSDRDGILTFVTPSILPLLGYDTVDDIIGHPITSFWAYPEKRDDLIARMKEQGYVKDYEISILKRDGTRIPVSVSSHFYHDETGGIAGVEGIIRDITDRKRADDAIRESEERYRNVVEDQTEFICRFKPDGTHIFVNEAYCRYFGLKRDEILGHWFRPKIPAEDQEPVNRFFASLTPDHPVDSIDHRIIMPDGNIRWQRWSDRAIFDPSGTVTEYQSVGRDITEWKRYEDALVESENNFRTILDQASDAIILHDRTGRILDVNRKACSNLGYTKDELLTKKISDFDPKGIRNGKDALWDQVVTGQTFTFESFHVRKDETTFPVEVTLGSIKLDNDVIAMGVVHDITTRKQVEESLRVSQEKYTKAFQSAPEAITISELDSGQFIEVNDAATKIFGYSREELLGRSAFELGIWLKKEDRDRFIDPIRKHHKVSQLEILERRKSGELYYALVNADILTIGNITYLIAIIHDITERKKTEKALRESEERFRSIVETSPDMIWEVDSQGIVRYISSRVTTIMGYMPEEIIGKSIADLVMEPAKSALKQELERYGSLKGSLSPLVVPARHPDGREMILEIRPSLTNIDGKREGFRGFAVDITERKRAEEALQEVNKKLNLLSSITRHDIKNQLAILQAHLALLEKKQHDASFNDNSRKIKTAVQHILSMIQFTKEYESIGVNTPIWQNCRTLADTAARQA
jgi:PAS domain S-box-containing protein